jgi:hypothetical protein
VLLRQNGRDKLNRGPVARDQQDLATVSEYVQSVAQMATDILNISGAK